MPAPTVVGGLDTIAEAVERELERLKAARPHQSSPRTPRPIARLTVAGMPLAADAERRSKAPFRAVFGRGTEARITAILAPAIGCGARKGEG